MRERWLILLGYGLFVVFFTFPLWRAAAVGSSASMPRLQSSPAGQCVEPVEQMRAAHMDMLFQWRKDAVRHNNLSFVAFNGKVYSKSLDGTCLSCHDKQQFCDRCHAYSGVSGPGCWNCHNDPRAFAPKVTP